MATKQVPFVLEVKELPPPPDYFPAIDPPNQAVLQGSVASYSISLTGQGGFVGPVVLSLANAPAGAVVAFSSFTINVGETVTLTIDTTGVAAGVYALILEATI